MADEDDEISIAMSLNNVVLREEVSDVFEAVTIDQSRLRVILNSLLTVAIKSSPIQQFGMGLGVGWISGYIFRRVSRTAAFLIGCGFLAIQGATALGIVTVNTQKIKQIASHNMREVENRIRSLSGPIQDDEDQSLYQRLINLSNRHMYISSGFISGAVIAFTF